MRCRHASISRFATAPLGLSCNVDADGAVPFYRTWQSAEATLTAQPQRRGGMTVGIGFSIFLFVVGAILTFALDVDSSGSGFNLNTVGVILMVGGLLGLLFSTLFWSSFSPWSRRRPVAGEGRVVQERRIERDLP
jgi:hypothetical protein